MEKTTTGTRLKQLMEERKLRQIDIQRLCEPFCVQYKVKLNRSDLSQYVNDLHAPTQEKLSVLAMALDVREAWLMGYDVPMERQTYATEEQPPDAPRTVEASIVSGGMDQLPEKDRQTILNVIRAMYPNRPELFPDKKGEKEDDH